MNKNKSKYEKVLENIYHKPSEGFRGATSLQKIAAPKVLKTTRRKLKKAQVQHYLQKNPTYITHAPFYSAPPVPIVVGGLNDQWMADIMYMKFNEGKFPYSLTAIDCYSRYGFCIPLKDKSQNAVINAFTKIFSEDNIFPPKKLATDQGTEFTGMETQKFFKQHFINHFTLTNPEVKAGMVERFNRTIGEIIEKALYAYPKKSWVDLVSECLENYNNSIHSVTGMKPSDLMNDPIKARKFFSKYKEKMVKKLDKYKNGPFKNKRFGKKIHEQLFTKGDYVRVKKSKNLFEKGRSPGWNNKVYKVKFVVAKPMSETWGYVLQDLEGDEYYRRIFKADQLQKVTKPSVFEIAEILGKRLRVTNDDSKIPEVLVKWQGYSRPTWIPKSSLRVYKRN